MYGQTSRAYQMLVDAYQIVLERMHLKNLILPAAMIAALCMGGRAHANHPIEPGAGEVQPTVASGPVGSDGTYAYTHTVDPNGVFAGPASPVTRTQGTQTMLIMYFHKDTDPDMYHATYGANDPTWYQTLARNADTLRSFYTAMSGGKMDFDVKFLDVPVTPKADGTPWDTSSAQNAYWPGLGINGADYRFKLNFYQPDQQALINNPNVSGGSAGLGSVPGPGTSGGQAWYLYTSSHTVLHEVGHNLSFSHDHSFPTNATPSYVYNYATRTYDAAPAGSGPINVPIGLGFSDYGSAYSVMGGGLGLAPRQKQSLGWLDASHFANIAALNTPGTTNTIKLYDDMVDMPVVVSKASGPDVKYGVAHGYRDVYYNAFFVRQGQAFHADSTNTGHWETYAQRFDLYYRSGTGTIPGYSDNSETPGVVVELNGIYLGRLAVGQTLLEKDVGHNLFVANSDKVFNMDDGGTVAGANTDLKTYTIANRPQDPARARSVWYQLTYLGEGEDGLGHWANLEVKSLTGTQVVGWQFDANGGAAGAQDGSGNWKTGNGNWRSVSTGLDNQNWTADEDAVFGAGGAAGTVTLDAAGVTANSVAFKPVGSNNYRLEGGPLTLTYGGIVAEESATIASTVKVNQNQFWTVAKNKALTVSGSIDTTVSVGTTVNKEVTKDGQGTLVLGGATTWNADLNVSEGVVRQTANQTFAGESVNGTIYNTSLRLNEGTTYQVAGGTLRFGDLSQVSGLQAPGFSTVHGSDDANLALGTLRLSSTTGSTAAPELWLSYGSTLRPHMVLDAGQHFINNDGTSAITGDISGAGGITLSGAASNRRLALGGRIQSPTANTFTGDIEIRRGSLHVVGATSLQGNNVLRFNNAAGDTGRFYLEGFDRSVRDLSSAGAGASVIANSRGSNDKAGTSPANLVVTQNNNGTFGGTITDTFNDGGGSGSAGALGVVKKGNATLTLTGNNGYTGGTEINAGTLRVHGASSLGTGAVRLAGGTLSVNQQQGLTRTAIPGTALSTAAVSGGSYTTDLSPLHNRFALPTGNTYAYTGKIYLTAGQWSFGENFDSNVDLKVKGEQILANGTWWQRSTGTLAIAADGWYDIDLRVYGPGGSPYTNSGWLEGGMGIGIKQGTNAGTNAGGVSNADGSLYTAFNPGVLGVKLKDRMNIANNIAVDSASTLEILDTASIGDVHLTGAISGAGALTKTGAGMVTLEGANTHTGATRIAGGLVVAGAADVLGSSSAYTLDNTAGVALNLNNFDQTIGSLAGGGAGGGGIAMGSGSLTVGGDNTSTTYAGTITGTGGFKKLGIGTMRLDFANAAVASNILSSSSALTIGGGVLEWQGKSGATNLQTVNGLTFMDNTGSALALTRNGALNTVDLRLGNLTVGTGSMADFRGGTGSAAGARFSFTQVDGTPVLADKRLGAFVTWNGAGWAANTGISDGNGGTYIGAYTGYTNIYNGSAPGTSVIQPGAASDVRINEATSGWGANTLGASSVTINSLWMAAGGHAAGVNMNGGKLIVGDGAGATGAIAVGVGAKGLTLGTVGNQGTLTSGTSGNSILGLISNNAAAADGLTVNAVIVDCGTGTGSDKTALLVSGGSGGGTVVLAGDNTHSGGTTVLSGATLQVGANGGTGTLGKGDVVLETGTKLVFARTDIGLVASNVISGAGSVTQNGVGTTTLSGNNTYAGTTTILAGGTLRIGNNGTSGTLGSGDVINHGTLAFNRSDTVTVDYAILGGDGTLAQIGGGTTILVKTNAYNATTISAGTLQIGADDATGTLGSGAVTVTGSGRLAFNRSDDLTISNALLGNGGLVKNDANTLIYIGTDGRTGGTTAVNAGTLQIGNGGAAGTLGSSTTTLASGAILEFNRSDALTVSGAISGAGTLAQSGAGTTTLTGANNYGDTRIAKGTLQIGDGGRMGTGTVSLEGGALDFHASGALTVSQVIAVNGTVSQTGTGTTILSGNNTYGGTTSIQDGILQVGNGGTTGSLGSSSVDNDAQLVFNRSDTLVVSNIISGEGTLRQMGAGTLVIASNNTYEGGTTIDAGKTLQVGNAGNSGNLGTGDIAAEGTLIFNRSNTFTASSVISGGGHVVQNGTGTTVLATANTYTGTTTVNAGILQLAAGGTLGTSTVTVNTGGTLRFDQGNFSASSSSNDITLSGGTVGINSWYSGLTLNGALTVGAAGGLLASHTGSSSTIAVNGLLTGNGALAFVNNGTFQFNNAANTYSGTITVGATTGQTLDVGASTALQYATVNLAPASSATNEVTFAPTVTAATFGGLTGNGFGGMRLQNRAGTPQAVALTVNNAAANQFDGVLSGTGSLTKTGAGQLTLTRANTHAGGTTVSSGTLALDFSAVGAASTNILSSTGAVTLNGGTLKIIGKSGQNGTVQTFTGLNSGTGTSTLQLVQNGATTMDINVGALSFGAGTLNFTGLTGAATGARVITSTQAGANNGATQLSASSALWNGTDWASTQSAGGGNNYVVKWTGTYTDLTTNGNASNPTGDLRIQNGTGTGTAATYGANTTINSLIMVANTHATTLAIGAAQTLTVGASASGNVAIAATGRSLTIGQTAGQGILTAGPAGTTATLNLANANAASLLTVNADIANNIGGTTSVSAAGAGEVVLNGDLSYTGSTTVGNGSRLTANRFLNGGNYAGVITNNGTLKLSGTGIQTLSGAVGGTGTLDFRAGTLKVGAANILGAGQQVTMANGTTLDTNGVNIGAAQVTLSGTGVGGAGALVNSAATRGDVKSLTLAGDATVNVAANGIIRLGAGTNDGALNLAGRTLTKDGAGTLLLAGLTASDAGDIVLNAGQLRFMDYDGGADKNVTISGAGSIRVNAGAAINIARWGATVNLSKAIVLNGGSIMGAWPGPNNATIASDISVAADSAITTGSITYTGIFSGSGALTLSGGTSTFSGSSTHSGATSVLGGSTFKGGAANAFSANSSFTLANAANTNLALGGFNQSIGSLAGGGATGGNVALGAGTLTLGANNASASYAGVIGGAGALTKVGSGVQTLARANTYNGLTTASGGTLALDYTAGSNIIASGNNLLLSGGTVRFDNLGTNTQTFGTTTLAAGTSSTLQRGAGWTAGVLVNLGTLGAQDSSAALEVTNIVAAPSWIRASGNLSESTLLSGAVTTNGGFNLVATDGSGNLILATVAPGGDYVRNATIPTNPGANVRLISSGGNGGGLTGTGFAGLSTVGTTDFGTLLNAYTSGLSTVDITNSGANAANILRMGASGAIVATAGSDLVIGASVAQGGTLTAGGAASTAGTLAFNAGNAITVHAAIKDNGSGQVALTKTGAGTLILDNANTYGGTTLISQGTLQVGNDTATGSLGAGSVTNNGVLAFNRNNAMTVANAISGNGSVNQIGSGTTTLASSNNTYSGATTIAGGTLKEGAHNALSANSAVAMTSGTLDLANFTGAVAGLNLDASGNILKMAANQTGAAQLASSGAVALNTGNTLDLTGMGNTAGLYRLVSGSSLTGMFGAVTGLDSAYVLKYGTVNANEVDAQHRATVTLSVDPAYDNLNVRAGTQQTIGVQVSNSAPTGSLAAAYALDATGVSGLFSGSRAAGTGFDSRTGTYTTVAGVNAKTVGITNTGSDAWTNNAPAAVTVTQTGYDYANAKYTGGTLDFGNVRKGAVVTDKTVAIGNQAVTNAAYQDKLDVSAGTDNTKVAAAGFSGLVASTDGATTSNVILAANTSSAGSLASTVALTLVSNANGVAGLSNSVATNAGSPAAITTTGGVYDYANAKYAGATLDFGNVRTGAAVADKTVAIGNQTVTDANYQDTLDVSGATDNTKVSATGFTGLAASTNGATTRNVTVAANTATAGNLASTVSLTLVSNANGVAGLSNGTATKVGTPTAVTTIGAAYDYAKAKYTGTTLDFGNVHKGATVANQTVAVGNQTVTDANYQDALDVAAATDNTKVNATGFNGLDASTNGTATDVVSVGINTAAAGSLASTVALTLTSNANGVAGLSNGTATTVGTPTAITTAGQVYSGFMNWTAGTGSFATHANWTDSTNAAVHVAAGLDAGFTGVDTATFTGSGGTVSLNGANANLNAITFAGGNYTLAAGSGGSLTLAGSNARITAAGTQVISAPLTLASNLGVAVTGASDSLTVSGAIGQSGGARGLTKTGDGTLTLTGPNTYTGATTVAGGTLVLDFSAAGAPAANIVSSSSALALNSSTLVIKGATGQDGVVQTFNGLTGLSGASTLQLVQNGATSMDINLGAISLVSGTINFVGATGTAKGARLITSTGAGTNDGHTQLAGTSALWNGTTWASVQDVGGTKYLVQWQGVSNDVYTGPAGGTMVIPDGASPQDIRIVEGGSDGTHNTLAAATTTLNSLLMTAGTTDAIIKMDANSANDTLVMGGGANASANLAIAAGGKSLTIGETANQGFLTAGTSGDSTLNFANASAGSTLTVNAIIKDNAGSGKVAVVVGASGAVFGGDNTYSGGTTITSGGTLQVGTGGDSGTLGSGNVLDNGALVFNRSDAALEVSNIISGTGSLTQDGTGTTTLTGNNAYEGITTISRGTLQIGNGGITGSLGSGNVVDNGTLVFNRSNAMTIANAISGTGSVDQIGTGTTTLTGTNTYSGATSVTNGTLAVGAHNALSTNSDLTLGGDTTSGTLDLNTFTAGIKSLDFAAGGGTVEMAANQTGAAQLTASGAVDLGTTNALDLTGMGTSAGLYRLIRGSSLTGTFGTVTNLNSNYVLKYGTVNANELDAQHRATVGLAVDAAYNNINVRTGTRTLGVQVSNTAPTGSMAGDYALSATGVTGLASGSRAAGTGFDSRTGTYTAVAGVNTKTVSITKTSGDAWTNPAPAAVTITQTAYDLANAKYSGTVLDFGTLHAGATANAKTVAIGNQTVTDANYQDTLDVAAATGNTKVTATGFTSLAASTNGATTQDLSIGVDTTTAGSLASTVALTLTSNANGVTGLSNGTATKVGTPTAITTVGQVYSGLMNWTAGSGAWATNPNWTDSQAATVHVAAGLDTAFIGVDTATFTGTGGTVTLDGANASLNAITFNGAGNYTLAQGTGGRITMAGTDIQASGDPLLGLGLLGMGVQAAKRAASITAAGTQVISAPLTLATNLNIAVVGTGGSLTLSGAIDQSGGAMGLAKVGSGTLTLTGANTYTGATVVSDGTLALDFSAAGAPAANILSASSSMVLSGGTLFIKGKAGQDGVVQTFNGLFNRAGTSTVRLDQNGATTMDINLGAILFNSGTINFLGATGTAKGARLITTTNAGANDGRTQLAGTSALWNGHHWASVRDLGGVKYVVEWLGVSNDVYTGTDGGTVVIPNDPHHQPKDVRILEGGSVGAPNTLAAATTTLNSLLMTAGTTASIIKMNANSANDTLVMGGGDKASANIAIAVDAKSLTLGETANQGFLTAGTSGDSTLNLANANANAVLTVNAIIKDNAGNGKVATEVAGTVVFAGDNTHSGGTAIATGGALQIGNGGTTGSLGSGDVVDNGALVFNRSDAVTVSNAISGTGSLTQAGTGTTTLAGATTYTGATSVGAGTLAFDAASTALTGQVTVGSNGTLAVGNDTGAANSALLSFVTAANNGMLRVNRDGRLNLGAGNGPTGNGTMAVSGRVGVTGTVTTTNAVTFLNTGTLLLADGSAKLNTGTLTIASGAKIAATSATGFAPGTLKAVAHGSSPVSGTFAVDTALSASLANGWRWITRTQGQDVLLGVLRTYLGTISGQTLQQQATSAGLSEAAQQPAANADVQAEHERLLGLSDQELNAALDRLGGHARASVEATAMRHAHDRGRNMLRLSRSVAPAEDESQIAGAATQAMRATALSDVQSGSLLEENLPGPQFFVRASQVKESRDAQATGVASASADGNLFTVGVYDQFGPGTNVGVSFTYDQTDTSTAGGLGKVDGTTYGFDLFASTQLAEGSPFYVSGDAGFGLLSTDSQRHGITPGNLTATSSGSGTELHVSGEFGCKVQPWAGALLTPYAGLSYVDNKVKSEQESLPGAPGLALGYQTHRTRSAESTLGADFAQSFDLGGGFALTPSMGAAWHHQLGDNDSSVVSTHFAGSANTPFNTYLGVLAEDALELTAAVAVRMPRGITLGVNVRSYRSLGSSNGGHQESVGANLQWNF